MPLANYLILLIVINYRWIATLATMPEGNTLDVTTQKLLGLGVIGVMVILMIAMAILYSKGKSNPSTNKSKWWHYAIFIIIFYLSSYAALTDYYIQISALLSVIVLGSMAYQIHRKKAIK